MVWFIKPGETSHKLTFEWAIQARGLHGLKIEAQTRPVPEIAWPDPSRAAQLNLEPEPEIFFSPQWIAN